MFYCARRSLGLSVESCASDFLRVERRGTQPWRSDWHCKGCEQGARHAGRSLAAVRHGVALDYAQTICARCHRQDDRFIRNRLCRSCDARDREMRRNRNGKGCRPRFLLARWHLHEVRLKCLKMACSAIQAVIDHASDVLEAILTLVRQLRQSMFGRVAYCAPRQLSFWGGC